MVIYPVITCGCFVNLSRFSKSPLYATTNYKATILSLHWHWGPFHLRFPFFWHHESDTTKWIYMEQLKNKTAFGRKHAFPSFLFSFFSLVCLQFRFKSREAFNLLQSSSVSREQKIIMKKRNTKIRYQQTVSISRQLFPF